MFTVALIGPDGAGKTTIGRRLERTLPLPIKYLYMGVNPASSNYLLPSTWLVHAVRAARGGQRTAHSTQRTAHSPNRPVPALRCALCAVCCALCAALRLANRLGEEWFRQGLAWYYQRRGCVVLFDRHFFADYYAADVAANSPRSLARRIHGLILERAYPRPDLVIYLDAPAEVLFARKGEGTIESLEQRRHDYLQMGSLVKHFVVVDGTQSQEAVAGEVAALIEEFCRTRRGTARFRISDFGFRIWGQAQGRKGGAQAKEVREFPQPTNEAMVADARATKSSQAPPRAPFVKSEIRNPKSEIGPGTVLVTDAGRGSAVEIIRSLGRRGWRVIAADCDPRSPGFRSRYARERLCYPAPEEAPAAYVAAIERAASEHDVDLIIPVTDATILPLAAARACFTGRCRLALPEPAALEAVTDKQRTLDLATRLGVPVPRSRRVQSVAEALEQAPALGWPVVLKPRSSRLYQARTGVRSFPVCYAENPEQLAARMKRFEGQCSILLQEYCSGTGYGVELLTDRGRPLAAFQHRRLREIPIHGGASALRESVPLDPLLYDYAVRLLKALEWTGLAMVEFKVGADGVRLMEINGRIWGSLPLAVRSGVDFPALLAELCLSDPGGRRGDRGDGATGRGDGTAPSARPVAPSPRSPRRLVAHDYRVGVRARNLELDLLWIAQVLRGKSRYPFLAMPARREGVAALFGLLNPFTHSDLFSFEDPGPAIAQLGQIGRTFHTKMREARTGVAR